jgi:glycosyltransferase involved in cell wall biosynthesis
VSRPLVSVVTPTWQRPELLAETIRHIREQDYRPVEHVLVSDGEDRAAARVAVAALDCAEQIDSSRDIAYRFTNLGRNWSGLMPDSFGIAPLTVGYLMARGEYLMPWCDDERALTPDHISRLVDLLESTGADFVYPKVRIWRNGNPTGPETRTIGTDPPAYCEITHYLFRASTLQRFGMPRWGTHPVDWSLVWDWISRGATWAHLDDCTFTHRLDQ